MLTAVRNFEVRALKWRDADLVDAVLRVRDSKTETGERLIALSPAAVEALARHKDSSRFQGDDDYVFARPQRGARLNPTWFAKQLRAALDEVGISEYTRPFHDLRHASLTNEAKAGSNPIALMTKPGTRRWRRRRSTCTSPGRCSGMRRPGLSSGFSAAEPSTLLT